MRDIAEVLGDEPHVVLARFPAELIEARATIAEQQQLVSAQQHAAVCAHQEYRRVVAERDALVARLMGAVVVWTPEGSRN